MRPCLQCGVILRFDQDPCPQCGARAKEDVDVDRIKACAACGELIAFAALYCPRCHELSVALATDTIPPDIELEPRRSALDRLPLLIGGIALLAGFLTLAVAVAEIVA
ncbi:MAG: hypothetical protein EXS13_11680 [Planctomycetes bacterium]|nr:hypothetical protein [Planctomycetota bacterium]